MNPDRRRSFGLFALGFALLLAAAPAWAQVTGQYVPSDAPYRPPIDPRHVDGIALGQPIDLSSTWLVKQGDDPRWADPAWDDSGWPIIQSGEPLKDLGFRNVDYLWYRIHIQIPARAHDLAIYTDQIGGSIEIYSNGVLVDSCGRIPPGGARIANLNKVCPIPDAALHSQQLTIAIRTKIGQRHPGDYFGPGVAAPLNRILLGTTQVLADFASLHAFRNYTSNSSNLALQLLLLLVALALALNLRSEREYLALVIYVASTAAWGAVDVIWSVYDLPLSPYWNLAYGIPRIVAGIALMEFVRLVLKLPRSRLFIAYECLYAAAHLLSIYSKAASSGAFLYDFLTEWIPLVDVPLNAGLPLLALWVWRKRRIPDALLLFIPLSIDAFLHYQRWAAQLSFRFGWEHHFTLPHTPFPALDFQWEEVATLFYSVALLVFIVLRTVRVATDRAKVKGELAAARSVQQVLLTGASERVLGWNVESIYEPASEVGGDFFQVIPDPNNPNNPSNPNGASVLIVAGDVAGKGLQAGMLVSVLVGAIRTTAEHTTDPRLMLESLNRRLLGRHAFATCLALRIAADGEVTLANAGHLAPYRNGVEVEMEGALPLGMIEGVEFPVSHFRIEPGDVVTLVSDGILEAQDKHGQLFGFDRIRDLLQNKLSPAALVAAAKAFGQNDDISVVSVTRA